MCTNCTNAAQHFSDGTQPAQRPLQTSVDQGTSPDWSRNDAEPDYDDTGKHLWDGSDDDISGH